MRIPSHSMKKPRNLERGSGFLKGTGTGYLRECHKRETDPKARDRLLVYMMRKEGMSIRGIAARTNRSYSTVRDWLVRARDGGLRGRRDRGRPGCPCRLDESQRAELLADLVAGPENCGFETRLWTARIVCAHIERKFGAAYSLNGVHKLLSRLGLSWRKLRPRNPKAASEREISEFKKKRGGSPSGTAGWAIP